MIYLKQVKLLDPDLVAGDPEELKYPYKAPAVRFTESFIFRKPVTFLVGENGAGKSTLLEAMMSNMRKGMRKNRVCYMTEPRHTRFTPMSYPSILN